MIFQRPFILKFMSEKHEVFHPDIVDLNVTIHNQSCISVNVNVGRVITQLFLDIDIIFDSGGGTYDLVYMNKTMDLCMFLSNRKLNAIIDITYRILTAYGELPKNCPVQKVRTF